MNKKRTFTDAQLEELRPFEENFRTAVYSRYARRIGGPEAARNIGRIYKEATGVQLSVYASCQDCMMRLLTQVGRAYLEDLEIIEAEKVEEAARRLVGSKPAPRQKGRPRGSVKTAKN